MVPLVYFIQRQSTHPFIEISELYLNFRLIVHWGLFVRAW